jgi:sigma-70-like protein
MNDNFPSSHEAIRASLATVISESRPDFGAEVEGLALSIHPWPDVELSDEVRRAIIGEINPLANLPHPDIREVASDRLLRLADVLNEFEGLEAVVTGFERAARTLASHATGREEESDSPLSKLVQEPSVFGPKSLLQLSGATIVAVDGLGSDAQKHEQLQIAGRLVTSVARTGSLDVGINLGQSVSGSSVGLIIDGLEISSQLEPVDRWLGELDERMREILIRRVLTFDRKETLESLGSKWGLTRERVRQLETKGLDLLEAEFGSMLRALRPSLNSLQEVILPVARFKLACETLTSSLAYGEVVASVVAWATGPWIREGQWIFHQQVRDRLTELSTASKESADIYGLVPDECPESFDEVFLTPFDRTAYLKERLGFVELNGYWSLRSSDRTRVAAALKRIGRAATRGEIADCAGLEEEARVGSHLSVLPGIVRADKDRWAFAEWVDDPYDGIVAEINQRIDANHGVVAVQSLLHELPERFGVSELSVRAFLQTPAYRIEDGFVQRADPGSFEPSSPSKWPDARQLDRLWGQRVRLESRHFAGYSLKVRFDIAYANGLRPECDLKVRIAGSEALASVIWRSHDATLSVDVGRISEYLSSEGYVPETYVFVAPNADEVVIRPWETIEDSNTVQWREPEPRDQRDPLFGVLEPS